MGEPEHFVVKEPGGDVAAMRESLGDVADVERLTDELVVVTPRETGGDGSAWWKRIQDAVRSAEWVAPAVVDDSGRPSYPTGAVTVRFVDAPTDAELENIAGAYDLQLVRRNEYIPEQIVFVPSKPRETFLPDLVERVAVDARVQSAWPVTMSRYERVDSR